MANSYYDATGVLVLDRVTPVIKTLFRAFHLDESYPGHGTAYIARTSDSNDPQWIDVLDGLAGLAAELDLPAPEDGEELTIGKVIEMLAKHFGTDQDAELENLIEHHDFEDAADLDALLLIASCLNDGHNLVAIQFEGCWHCSKPGLFEFGGDGCFLSREVRVFSASSQAPELGRLLRQAIVAGNFADASDRIARETLNLLAGITDDALRTSLREQVAQRLLADSPLAASN